MKIINIVDNATPVNTGIWNAAISTAKALKENYGVESELWYPKMSEKLLTPFCSTYALESTNLKYLDLLIHQKAISKENTIIITHGCWQFPTIWGNKFKSLGYKWIFVPQGMLEPWSLKQKKLLKFFYLNLVEKPKAIKADIVRAVSSPEQMNLSKIFSNVELIPNGVSIPKKDKIFKKASYPIIFLFMARLHHKKGIKHLIDAWKISRAYNHPEFKLIIAGPDHGEWSKIESIVESSNNIKYVGMVTGNKKNQLLSEANFYILPSYSEGFPSSVVESMSYGMIPLISKGCNFPEAINNEYAIEISTESNDIAKKINFALEIPKDTRLELGEHSYHFILENYSIDQIAKMQYCLYKKILSQKS